MRSHHSRLSKNGRFYRWRRTVNGKRLSVQIPTTVFAEAVVEANALDRKTDGQMPLLHHWSRLCRIYVAQMTESRTFSLNTAKARLDSLKIIGRRLEVKSVNEVTEAKTRRLIAFLQENRSIAYTNTCIHHLQSFVQWCVSNEHLLRNPIATVKPIPADLQPRETFLPAPHVKTLLEAAKHDPELHLILLLGFECGMRKGEIIAATPEWLSLHSGIITIPARARKGRTGRRRGVSIPMVPALLDWFTNHGTPAPFLICPDAVQGKHRYRFEPKKRVLNFFKKHGHEELSMHDMRRSFGSNGISAGVSIEKVANWLGIHPKTAWNHYAKFIPADDEIMRGSAAMSSTPALPRFKQECENLPSPADDLAKLNQWVAEGLISKSEAEPIRARLLKLLFPLA